MHQGTPYGFTRPDNDVILSYDATVTLLESCDNVLNSGKQQPAPSDIQKSLRELSGDRGWQGISGQIALGPDGNPIDKALVVLYVDEKGFIHMQQDILGRFIKS